MPTKSEKCHFKNRNQNAYLKYQFKSQPKCAHSSSKYCISSVLSFKRHMDPQPSPYLPTDNLGNNLALARLTCTQEAKRKPTCRLIRSCFKTQPIFRHFYFSNLEMSNYKTIFLPLIISFGPQVLYITLPHDILIHFSILIFQFHICTSILKGHY